MEGIVNGIIEGLVDRDSGSTRRTLELVGVDLQEYPEGILDISLKGIEKLYLEGTVELQLVPEVIIELTLEEITELQLASQGIDELIPEGIL